MDAMQTELRKANIRMDSSLLNSVSGLQLDGFLSFGWPTASVRFPHFVWFPQGKPKLRTAAVVSSRLERRLDHKDDLY